jgi:hypothetical protein
VVLVIYIQPLSAALPLREENWNVTEEKNQMAQLCWLRVRSEESVASLASLQTTRQDSLLLAPPSTLSGALYLLIDHGEQTATVLRQSLVPHFTYLQHEDVPCDVISRPVGYSVARVSFIIDGLVRSEAVTGSQQ